MNHGYQHSGHRIPLIILLLLSLLTISTVGFSAPENITIGVLAKRGPEKALRKWTSTAQYLNEQIPEYTFTIVPLDFEALYTAVEGAKLIS